MNKIQDNDLQAGGVQADKLPEELSQKQPQDKQSHGKKSRIILLIFSLLFVVGVTALLAKPMTEFVSEPEKFRIWMEDKGIWGVLVFMAMNIVQVFLAIIPGGPFEIAAGYAFGVIKGTLICDLSMTLASVIVFLFVRKFGMKFVLLFTTKEKIESLHFLKATPKGIALLSLFFLIPGTPKDLMSYAVGLTDIPLWIWVLINFVGRFPAIFLSASSGSAINGQQYSMAIFMIAAIVVLYGVGMIVYNYHMKKHKSKAEPKEE